MRKQFTTAVSMQTIRRNALCNPGVAMEDVWDTDRDTTNEERRKSVISIPRSCLALPCTATKRREEQTNGATNMNTSCRYRRKAAWTTMSLAPCAASSRRQKQWALVAILVILLSVDLGLVQVGHCASVPGLSSPFGSPLSSLSSSSSGEESSGPSQPDPLARLSRVFGIKRIPGKVVHRTPPQYMTELYSVVADTTGLTKASGPYNANTVRSFPDRDSVHQEHFFYNVSHLQNSGEDGERMLEAEFHVFKMKPRPSRSIQAPPPHHLQLRVYQVLDKDNMYSKNGLRLLDVRRISTHAHGWYTFKVTKAVESWRSNSEANHGLLVTAQSSQGDHYNGSYVRFAQRNHHHDSKQPILVVFTDDGSTRHPTYVTPDDEDYQQIREEMLERNLQKAQQEEEDQVDGVAGNRRQQQQEKAPRKVKGKASPSSKFSRTSNFRQAVLMLNERARAKSAQGASSPQTTARPSRGKRRRRRRREAGSGRGGGGGKKNKRQGGRRKRMYDGYRYRRSCAKHKMYVDFDEIGWSGWIISPKGYDAYHCTGECPFPLGQSQKPTNHATVQSIVHALRVGTKHVGTPCCVPNKLFSISLLYFDDDENVILKQYDDMVAASCGCH